jgi:hypothetical protein
MRGSERSAYKVLALQVELCSPRLIASRAEARRRPSGFRPGIWPQGQSGQSTPSEPPPARASFGNRPGLRRSTVEEVGMQVGPTRMDNPCPSRRPSSVGGRKTSGWGPKDVDHGPRDFPLHKHPVLGTAGRGHHRLVGPLASRRRMLGDGHAPVVAVLSRVCPSQASPAASGGGAALCTPAGSDAATRAPNDPYAEKRGRRVTRFK